MCSLGYTQRLYRALNSLTPLTAILPSEINKICKTFYGEKFDLYRSPYVNFVFIAAGS